MSKKVVANTPTLNDAKTCAFELHALWSKYLPNYNAEYLSIAGLKRYLNHRLKSIKRAKIKVKDEQSALAEFARQVEELTYGEILSALEIKNKVNPKEEGPE